MSKSIRVLLIIIAALVIVNFFSYSQIQTLNQVLESFKNENSMLEEKISTLTAKIDTKTEEPKPVTTPAEPSSPSIKQNKPQYSTQSITAVAVRPILERDGFFERTSYEGTTMNIAVSVRDGQGLVLVNTEIPTGVDFQTSAKTAVKVAENYLGVNLSDKDIIFSITAPDNSNLNSVDGQSAGAAMTVLLINELQGKTINGDVVITGTIMSDGTIGKIGGVSEKADAAGKYGAKVFLVPQNQAITQVEKCQESKAANIIYKSCTLEEKPLSGLTEEEYGMKVIEVNTIDEALKFFVNSTQ